MVTERLTRIGSARMSTRIMETGKCIADTVQLSSLYIMFQLERFTGRQSISREELVIVFGNLRHLERKGKKAPEIPVLSLEASREKKNQSFGAIRRYCYLMVWKFPLLLYLCL